MLDAFSASDCGRILKSKRTTSFEASAYSEVEPFIPAEAVGEAQAIFNKSRREVTKIVTGAVRAIYEDHGEHLETSAACGALLGVISDNVAKAKVRWTAEKNTPVRNR